MWSPEQVLIESDMRLAAKRLHHFVRLAWHIVEPDRPFQDGRHIKALCDHYQNAAGELGHKSVVNIPPGCCKSLISGVFLPAWVWGPHNKPAARFFHASYEQGLATRDSIRCRDLIRSDWYRKRWQHVELKGDQYAKTRFHLTGGGWRMATTPTGRGLGEHPDWIIADDPHNVRGAESEAERQTVRDWWSMTIPTRGKSRGARRFVVMQRLHESDISGLSLEMGFDHFCLPMRAEGNLCTTGYVDDREEGELLWPQMFGPEDVADLEQALGSYAAAAQLQQRPAPRTGGFFQTDKLEIVPDWPREATHSTRGWDKAGTAGGGDYTAGVKIVKHEGLFYITDVKRGRWSAGEREQVILQTAQIDRDVMPSSIRYAVWLEQEPGSGGKESAANTIRNLAGFDVRAEVPTGPKDARARGLAAQIEAGNVKLVRGGWNKAFLDELGLFPFGSHDDQVDAAALAFNKLVAKQRFSIARG